MSRRQESCIKGIASLHRAWFVAYIEKAHLIQQQTPLQKLQLNFTRYDNTYQIYFFVLYMFPFQHSKLHGNYGKQSKLMKKESLYTTGSADRIKHILKACIKIQKVLLSRRNSPLLPHYNLLQSSWSKHELCTHM